MAGWLVAAGIYNLLWGALTVLYPGWLFDLTGMDRPDYSFIWQCLPLPRWCYVAGEKGCVTFGYLEGAGHPAHRENLRSAR